MTDNTDRVPGRYVPVSFACIRQYKCLRCGARSPWLRDGGELRAWTDAHDEGHRPSGKRWNRCGR